MSITESAAEWVAVGDLVPWDQNPRVNDAAVGKVAASIKRFGFGAPIVARRADGMVIAGHTRLKAALKLGMAEVPCMLLDVDDRQADAIAIADNRLGELAEWDGDELGALLRELEADGADMAAIGYDDSELAEVLAGLEPDADLPDDGEVTEPPDEPDSRLGEVYELGPHRLVCGDSTDGSIVAFALGTRSADMTVTDPPYGIGYQTVNDRGLRDIAGDSTIAEAAGVMLGAFAHAVEPAFVFCDWRSLHTVIGAVESNGLKPKAVIVWDKTTPAQHLDRYFKQHEFIVYCGPYGGQKTMGGDVWAFAREYSVDHPTPKPVELLEHAMETAGSRGDVVLDMFGGSGSTLIACARSGRSAALIELDPGYCDVIRRRWTTWADAAGVDAGTGALRG